MGGKLRRWVLTGTIILVLLGGVAAVGWAQGVQSFSVKLSSPANSGPFLGGGGPLFVGALLDLSGLEASVPGVHFRPDLGNNGIFLLRGGGGFGGNEALRMGGLGVGASWTTPVENSSEFDKARFSLDYGGVTLERLIGTQRQLAAAIGVLLGRGSFELQLFHSVSGDFAQVTAHPNSVQLKRSFLFAQPYLSAEYKLLDFAGLRVTLGYWFSVSFSGWQLSGGQSVVGGPLTSLGMPVIQIMLVFGG